LIVCNVSDVRGFLEKHSGMNATLEVFAAHYTRTIAVVKSKAESPAPDRPPRDRGRGH
jgi:type IV secretion system T-DNA border endonuclease VirD2